MIHTHITYGQALDFILFVGFALVSLNIVRSIRRRWPVE
jgi:hypothetical protein